MTFKGQANLQSRPFIQYYLVNTTTPYNPATAYDPNTNTTVLDAVVTDGGAGYSEDPITLDVADADRLPISTARSSRTRNCSR